MTEEFTLSLYEIVGSPLCVTQCDGEEVFERLNNACKRDKRITLSFQNISTITPAFLNAAIGQLYGIYTEDKIRELLKVRDAQQTDLMLLKRVVETAKQYFNDHRKLEQAQTRTASGENRSES